MVRRSTAARLSLSLLLGVAAGCAPAAGYSAVDSPGAKADFGPPVGPRNVSHRQCSLSGELRLPEDEDGARVLEDEWFRQQLIVMQLRYAVRALKAQGIHIQPAGAEVTEARSVVEDAPSAGESGEEPEAEIVTAYRVLVPCVIDAGGASGGVRVALPADPRFVALQAATACHTSLFRPGSHYFYGFDIDGPGCSIARTEATLSLGEAYDSEPAPAPRYGDLGDGSTVRVALLLGLEYGVEAELERSALFVELGRAGMEMDRSQSLSLGRLRFHRPAGDGAEIVLDLLQPDQDRSSDWRPGQPTAPPAGLFTDYDVIYVGTEALDYWSRERLPMPNEYRIAVFDTCWYCGDVIGTLVRQAPKGADALLNVELNEGEELSSIVQLVVSLADHAGQESGPTWEELLGGLNEGVPSDRSVPEAEQDYRNGEDVAFGISPGGPQSVYHPEVESGPPFEGRPFEPSLFTLVRARP